MVKVRRIRFYGLANGLAICLDHQRRKYVGKKQKDLALKVAGGSQQAVDAVRWTVSQGEGQQLLSGLQVPVSLALTQQAAHIPGRTVSWRKED